MVGPPKNKKGKQAASPPAMFAIDYAADLGKVVKISQDAWLFLELKGHISAGTVTLTWNRHSMLAICASPCV